MILTGAVRVIAVLKNTSGLTTADEACSSCLIVRLLMINCIYNVAWFYLVLYNKIIDC